MENNKNGSNQKPTGAPQRPKGSILVTILIIVGLSFLFNWLYTTLTSPRMKEVTYTKLWEMVENQEIAEVRFDSGNIIITTNEEKDNSGAGQTLYYAVMIDQTDVTGLVDVLLGQGAAVSQEPPEEVSFWQTILIYVVMFGCMYLLFTLVMKKAGKNMGGGFNMGQSKAKVYMEKKTGVTFADVAGQDEAKESLQEIIDFLHNPQKYTAIGAKLPKGALLVGSPGTGKTLLAKAVAGEANVPFFSISGSDFVEMFVGVGASRVWDLFKEAAKVAPAIIFIDEIDAIGRTRDSRFGGNDEREQTLNQLLAEIDGFDSSKGVVIRPAPTWTED